MLYADKIMNTERYKELKDVGNKIAKQYLYVNLKIIDLKNDV